MDVFVKDMREALEGSSLALKPRPGETYSGLVTLIKQDPRLAHTPVMIVSYKDRDEDRRRGLEAGADFYLTKGSFHDETLLQAVHDLVGSALAQETT